MTWTNASYEFANTCMVRSWQEWDAGKTNESWGYTLPARLCYLADVITNIVVIPFALLSLMVQGASSLLNWANNKAALTKHWHFCLERSNHLVLSLAGSLVSPALAHKYRDANLTPWIIAARVTAMTAFGLYLVFRH